MAPSRRRGPSGKTSGNTARSAAIQAAERRRKEEQEHNNNNNDTDESLTAKDILVGYDEIILLESPDDDTNNRTTTTTTAATIEAGKKRKKDFSSIFAGDTGTSTTMSTASSPLSSSTQEVVVATAKQLLSSQPFCKLVPEEHHRFKTICDQRATCEKMLCTRREGLDYSDRGYDNDDEYDDENDNDDEGCLHCHRKVKNMPKIQVIDDDEDDSNGEYCGNINNIRNNIRVDCDGCRGYICNACHWCHEFQANHEIRVCDRCDSYYCRGCDEMDQCDDCGEVVCGSCSTLLSCKFCGGGLCEDCATACGRCGIVLCSRDAKFAVDCDTCRLSYCLVCLASGSKDPCVRCGHRPSKRMEQLVHLRLKSIYKAFKSSSSSAINGGGNSNSTNTSKGGKGNTNDNNDKKDGGRSLTNKPTTLEDMEGDHDEDDDDPVKSIMMGATAGVLPQKFCHDLEQNYLAEQKKADAAAEALLAELEEEETAIAQKKSKKKKKKERKNANKQAAKPATKGNSGGEKDGKSDANSETKQNPPHRDTSDSRNDDVNTDPSSETDSADEGTKVDDEAGNKLQKAEEIKMDPIEKELVECVNNVDLDGIESILCRLKGVPGRAALRKNAKKALKRLKLELNPPLQVPPKPKLGAGSKPDWKSTNKLPPAITQLQNLSKKTITVNAAASSEKPSYKSSKSSHPKSSRKDNGKNRCEAQVEIVSRLVGWMIGKNGQRIRDLMEESGAKIWIDQEKIKGQETRNVYISGNRKSVDHAVILVNDVITNAPPPQGTSNNIATATASMANMTISKKAFESVGKIPTSVQSSSTAQVQPTLAGTVEVKSAWTKTAGSPPGADKMQGTVPKPPALISSSTAEGTKTKTVSQVQGIEQAPGLLTGVPNMASDTATRVVGASIQPNLQQESDEVTTEIVSCDVRFVPLLIGKRGWTIKNIQDDSGARVDIDQSVTPRQVRISGSKANVDRAVAMVRDVLSYPHAQLQSSSEVAGDDENVVAPALGANMQLPKVQEPRSTPTEQKLVAASAFLESDARNSERIHSPPPVVGDAKTAISATSSLSSTPEPSMASSSKGFIPSHLQNAPLLPPPPEQFLVGNSAAQPVERQFLQPEGAFVNGLNAGAGLWASAGVGSGATAGIVPQASYARNTEEINFHIGRTMAMPQGAPLHPQAPRIQQPGRHLQLNASMVHGQQLRQGNPNENMNLNHQPLFPTGDISHQTALLQANPDGGPLDRISQLSHQNIGNFQQNPLRDLMHSTGVRLGPAVSSPTRGPGLWNAGNPTNPMAQTQGEELQASSGLAPGISTGHHQISNGNGMANAMGYLNPRTIPSQQSHPNTYPLSLASNPTPNFAGSISPGLRNDDSRMIDSLFGGGNSTQSSNVAATNTVLAGLSLPKEGVRGKPSGLWGSPNLTEDWHEGENMFSEGIPNRTQDHPPESRFNWD